MTSRTVWYQSRQTECCGTPFSAGDEAALPSMITPGDRLEAVEEWPQAVGRVRSVRILTHGYAPGAPGGRTRVPVPGERWLRPVDACPKWFGGGGAARRDDGALVVLDALGGPGGRSARGRGQ